MTISAWLAEATQRLTLSAIDSPRLSALLLLTKVTDFDRVYCISHPDTLLSETQLQQLKGLLRRREEGEPVAYLLGQREFYGRDFWVNPATLVPRPETELLVDYALNHFPKDSPLCFVDWGTGSGCLAVTLCAERPLWRGIACDISLQALKTAKKNAQRHAVDTRLLFTQADMCFSPIADTSVDLIVSNPPYIAEHEFATLSIEVRDYEPRRALVPNTPELRRQQGHNEYGEHTGAANGLELIEKLVPQTARSLHPQGLLLIEHGYTQGQACCVLFESHTWKHVSCNKDLAQKDRFVSAIKKDTYIYSRNNDVDACSTHCIHNINTNE